MNDSVRTNTTISSTKSLVLRFQLSAILHLLLLSFTPFSMSVTAEQHMNRAESHSLRRGMLRKLGLEHVPVQTGPSIDVPQHMWDIYDDDNDVDWVRHYYPKEIVEENDGFILAYNLSLAARNAHNEEVTKAILKLRLRRNNKTRRSGNFTIYFYKDDMNNDRFQIESRSVDNLTDWIDFDVTAAFSRRTDRISFFVELPENVEIEETQSTSMSSLPYAKAQSAPLIVFSDLSEPSSVRRKRSAQTGNSERKNRKKGRKHHINEAESNLCRRTDLYVDFDDLGWQDWILAPKGYDAYQCQGTCPNPMPAQLNASNHAIIQSLLHSLKPDEVPPPCCVPTETSPLSILYMDVDKVIVIKEYADMRVDSCGCR
uniref:TGF_BETA_2 domain-containing protein n=1 Tax=Caenorhabditis tropicalis TaxID=1561998 RepID=A0A1I7TFK7_9PELO